MSALHQLELPPAAVPGTGWRETIERPFRDSSILLLAHDRRKEQLVDLAICYRDILVRHQLIATPTTARVLHDMAGLVPITLSSGLDGNDAEIVDCVQAVRMAAVIFLVDPFTRRAHEPNPGPVLEACGRYDIPLATNIATATAVLNLVSVFDAAERLPVPALREK